MRTGTRVGRVLGVDLGAARIGLALSDATRTLASPLEVLARSGDPARDTRTIIDRANEMEADLVIVGLPLGLDGSIGTAARSALDEVDRLRSVAGDSPAVETHDERLTTVTAEQILREQGIKGQDRRRVVDKVAAAVMLQSWLDGQP